MGCTSSVKDSREPLQTETVAALKPTKKTKVRETVAFSLTNEENMARFETVQADNFSGEKSIDSDDEEDEIMMITQEQQKDNTSLANLVGFSRSDDVFIAQNKEKIQQVIEKQNGDTKAYWETVCIMYMKHVAENGSWKDIITSKEKAVKDVEELQNHCVEQINTLEAVDCYNSEKSLEALYKLCRLSDSGACELGEILVEKNFGSLFEKIWESLHGTMRVDLAQDYNDTKEYLSLSLLKEATIAFAKFSPKMCLLIGPKIIPVLADEFSVKACTVGVLNTGSSKLYWNSYRESLKRTLIILYYMVKNSNKNKSTMRELHFVLRLQPYLKCRFMIIRARALFLLVYIVNEDENEQLSTGNINVGFLVRILEKTLNEKDHISRHYSFSTCEVVDGISELAKNDMNKRKFVEVKAETLSYLQQIMESGLGIFEKRSAARAIWMLSFHPENQSIIREYPKMAETLDYLANQTPNQDTELKKACKGAMWQSGITESHGDKQAEGRDEDEDDDNLENINENGFPHVMISYQWDVQPLTLHLKDLLRQAGFNVWIDVECIGGSTLEAMAKAVEDSAVVLICLTEKYKESPSCRTEAEYTYKLRKPYVPLRMQEDYDADGWLGVMMGTKLWIGMSSTEMIDRNIEALIKELGQRGRSLDLNDTVTSMTTDALHTTMSTQRSLKRGSQRQTICAKEVASWNQKDVLKWLQKYGLESYKTKFNGYDGQRLLGLKTISSEAPDFFYNALKSDMEFKNLLDIVKFKQALGEIL